jgi:hypothetical protein
MAKYHEGLPASWYQQPPGITTRVVCVPSGLLPTASCQNQRSEIFVPGTEPTLPDNIWQAYEIDKTTGKLAAPSTPPENRELRVYQMLPQEAADWVRENGIPQPPTEQAEARLEDFDPDVAIISPQVNGYIGGVFEIKGNARGGPFRVEFGRGLEPQEWTMIGSERGDEVVNGTLQMFDTNGLEEGSFTLRLTVNRGDGAREMRIPVTIDHTPPTVVVTEPKPDQLYVMEDAEQININALVQDTWAVDRVVFYIDNSAFVTSTVSPYNERWKIQMRDVAQVEQAGTENWLGFPSEDPEVQNGRMLPFGNGFQAIRTSSGVYFESHVIKVRAVDEAGNETWSDEVRVYVRHKKAEQ